jgi:Fe/S biogenesis protein NfuA
MADATGDRVHPATVLTVTEAARVAILEARAAEADPEGLALFVEVSGSAAGAYVYEMWFEALADAGGRDAVSRHGELTVVVAGDSVESLRGATLDLGEQGLVMVNPNAARPVPTAPAVAAGEVTSPLAAAVIAVLEEQVNPQIAFHGGRADLVGVDEGVAYLRLSGGCQGCGLAAVTLSQGIIVAIKQAVPEIVDVVDVTSHQEGRNPYYEPARK